MKPQNRSRDLRAAASFTVWMTGLAILYGIAHDLVTAHVSVDYFTVHHPKLVESQSPLVMALLWGFLATFWVGGIAGMAMAATNLIGGAESLPWSSLRTAAKRTMATVWVGAMLALGTVYAIASLAPMDKRGPTFEHDRKLVAVAIAHGFSYSMATLATVALCVWIAAKRMRLAKATSGDESIAN